MLGFVVQLPFALPPLTSGILLLFLIGYHGPFGHLIGASLPSPLPESSLQRSFNTREKLG